MRMRQTIGLSLALLVASTAAMAKQTYSGHDQPVPSIKSKPAKADTAAGKPPASGTAPTARWSRARYRRKRASTPPGFRRPTSTSARCR